MGLPKVLVILGPTATNKTSLAIKLANDLNGEIINCDVFQTYKELSIGVNKPNDKELKQAKFHLVNEISLTQEWDIKKFKERANQIIKQLLDKNKLPIICGGSSLYTDALIKNYDLDHNPNRTNEFDSLSNEQLYEQLSKYSKELADKNKNNHKRLSRALEIYSQSNSSSPMNKTNNPIYDFKIVLCTYKDRHELYEKINQRVNLMINSGWIDEVKSLIKLNIPNLVNLNGFKAIGYKSIYDSIIKNEQLNIDKIKQDTRHYAKRQITWIRHHYENYLTFNQDNYGEILESIKQWIK